MGISRFLHLYYYKKRGDIINKAFWNFAFWHGKCQSVSQPNSLPKEGMSVWLLICHMGVDVVSKPGWEIFVIVLIWNEASFNLPFQYTEIF